MDTELLELQRLFEAQQQSKASVRLSERNIVELVTKLQDLRLLPPLLHTVSGKEYLTQDRLRNEMKLEIQTLGRVSLIDLANTIGVDLFHCEKQVESILTSLPNLTLVQGEIIATSYWDAIAEEINESLQETGQVSLADLAAHLNVGSDTLTAILESRMGKLIHGKLEGGRLYTQAYVTRLRAMIRGAVRALMVPTNLSTVWGCLQQELLEIEGGSGCVLFGDGNLFQSLFNGLLKEGAFSGSLRAGASVWTPAVFEKAQQESVEAFYSQNSYISYDMLRKLAIAQPKQFLQEKYSDGIALEMLFVHPSFVSMVDAAVEEAINEDGWVDCVSLLPMDFSVADVARLVSLCPYIQRAAKEVNVITLAETCVVGSSFVKGLLEKLEVEIKDLVALNNAKGNVFEAKQFSTDGMGNSFQGSNAKKKAGGVAPVKVTVLEAGYDESISVKGSRGKRKGGKSRSGNQSAVTASNKGSKGSSWSASSTEEDVLSESFLASRIMELSPDLEGAGIGDHGVGMLSEAIAAYIRPSLLATWETSKQASFSVASEDRRRRADALQKKIDESYANFQLFAKALSLFEDDPSTLTALHRHLLRTTGAQLADVILQMQDFERRAESDGICDELQLRTEPLSSSERLFLAKGFGGVLTSKCVKMVEALEAKVVEEFELALQGVADECGLRLKKLDKKAERALLSSNCKESTSRLENESDPVSLLPRVVGLLFTKVHNKALQAPGRAIASAISHLKKMIPDDHYNVLVEYQSATVALLSMASISTPGASDCTSDRMESQREKLISMMPRLKEIALISRPGM